jgi:acetyl esterase
MALDEATSQFLAGVAASGGKALPDMSVEEAREVFDQMAALSGEGPEMVSARSTRVPTTGGNIPVRLLVPVDEPRGLIVYYHGGGWVIGSLAGFETLGRVLASRTGCAVLLVDYRMAPEYRFPTAVEDAWTALRWADEHRVELAGGPVPLIVAGDSAGGNLSAVVAQRANASGGPELALQVLVYPVTDCDFATTTYLDPDNQIMLTRESMIWFWDHYAPVAAAREHQDASPLRNPALADLPPAVVLTAEHDVLRDEGELYATRLLKAGVPVRHQRFSGQMHGFFTMVNVLPGSQAAIDYVVAAIEDTLAGTTLTT